ncbi:hypothetical protein HUB98_15695 [Paenibacillus barcinonensis]|uniref:Uncharacterized protein n=1 Tax=Paenibacillus barcinonensis TaxID=198119 RepID=A0A2V4UVJ8_PAEBA|nr:hypothetical protein [Paenibacillus barcinonensis]PYE44227.1 hypothetical protein DFQ00_1254 [Paenibacillus barcinonensis]QKS57604.1 hypothetical protein HUB98_15695 [Paenibacillus barcinonensis]
MFISDKTYHQISDAAYVRDITGENEKAKIEGSDRADLPNSTLNDTNGSGFDAVVYYNKKDNKVVIGLRTSNSSRLNLLNIHIAWSVPIGEIRNRANRTVGYLENKNRGPFS